MYKRPKRPLITESLNASTRMINQQTNDAIAATRAIRLKMKCILLQGRQDALSGFICGQ